MGNQLARTTQVSASEFYLGDLPSTTYNLTLKEILGGGRIFKSIQCTHDEGLVVVKVYFKRGELGPELREQERKLQDIAARLKDVEHSHVWPFQTWRETDKAAYLLRQYFFNNLRDRVSTRPFLSNMEKKWLAFQLLYAVKQCHERGVCHGDIKCENVLVTSWNWVYLVDFASYKPTYLPADNPSDFSYFFDTGGLRRCYVAPERFYDPLNDSPVSANTVLKPPMDIFSVGCVIAELFLEGQQLFDLSQLLAYRKGQYDPCPSLKKIPDEGIQKMVQHMIQIFPADRASPEEYLNTWGPTVFPSYFSPLLHKFFSCLVPLDTDTRVAATQKAFPEIRKQMLSDITNKRQSSSPKKGLHKNLSQDIKSAEGGDRERGPAFDVGRLSGRVDVWSKFAATKYKANGRIHRVKAAAVAMALKQNPMKEPEEMFNYTMEPVENVSERASTKDETGQSQGLNILMMQEEKHILRMSSDSDTALGGMAKTVALVDQQPYCKGMVLIAALLCSCLRNVRLPQARWGAIQLLHDASRYCDDDARLQHILPYVVTLLTDPAAIVRCAALQTLCSLLFMVQNIPLSDAKIFPEYILPSLSKLPNDLEECVRIAYADNIQKIATASHRFLLNSQYMNEIGGVLDSPARPPKGSTGHHFGRQDIELSHLREAFARIIQELVMGPKQTSTIGRALLQHVGALCPFFGSKQCNDSLLPILPAFLNDRDEQLRAVFFEYIVHVCLYVGQASLEAYLLPYIEQALSDVEAPVIVNALECLAALCVHRVLKKRVILGGVERAAPLLCHPSQCVRRAAVTFVSATSAALEPVDSHAFLSPILGPFLRREPASLCSENSVLACLKSPVSREEFNRVLSDVMLSQTLPEAAPATVKLKPKTQLRVAPIQPAHETVSQTRIAASVERRKQTSTAETGVYPGELKSKLSSRKSSAGLSSPNVGERPPAGEDEDGEKMKAMEGYIRNLSSTMQSRMHTREAESSEKLESSTVGLSSGVGAGYYDLSSEGIPLLSTPVPEKRMDEIFAQGSYLPSLSSYNDDWSRILSGRQGVSLGPSSSQWAAIPPQSSVPASEAIYRSISAVPLPSESSHSGRPAAGLRRVHEVVNEGGRDGESSSYITSGVGMGRTSSMNTGILNLGNAAGPIAPIFEVYPAPDSVTALLGSCHLGQSAMETSWRPKGVLIAHLQEHKLAVNEISVASDQIFFVSGSDDGTVKVWDCRRLERDVSFRSKLTYSSLNGRVLCVKMLSDGHQFAAATSGGTIHIVNVDYQARLGNSNERYVGFSDVRKLDSDEGAVLCLQNFAAEGSPRLLYTTQRNGIHLWDLRSSSEAWALKEGPEQGYISATALDSNGNWLVTGTSRGVLTLWDLRFLIPVFSWQHASSNPIESMCPLLPRNGIAQPTSARPFVYIAAGQNEISLWNAADGSCHQVMKLAPDSDSESTDQPVAALPRSSNVSSRSGVSGLSKPSSTPKPKDYRREELNEPPSRLPGVRALLPLAGGAALLSGGTDCRVRMWDRQRPEQSYTVCAPSTKAPEHVSYETRFVLGARMIQELVVPERHGGQVQGNRSPSRSPNRSPTTKHGLLASALDSVGCHRDCILTLAAAQVNQKILISGARDGAIKVWK